LVEPWINEASFSWSIKVFIFSFGHIGVDLFFVLSGYLIYGMLIKSENTRFIRYIKRRAARIYPTFLFVFLIYIILSFFFTSESKIPSGYLNTAIYILQNILLLPGIFDIKPVITVAWSLSYEVFYYLLIPLIISVLQLRKWNSTNRIYFWLIASLIGFYLFYIYTGPVRLLMFISGIILFECHNYQRLRVFRNTGTVCLIFSFIIFGIKDYLQIDYVFFMLSLYILFFTLCLDAFKEDSGTNRWISYNPLRWLGNMSYSYYLIHGLTLKFIFLIMGLILPATHQSSILFYWLWVPLFVSTVCVSFILFVLIERPFSLSQAKSHKNHDQIKIKAREAVID